MSLLSKSETYNEKANQRLFKILSIYLNLAPDYIENEMIDAITCGNKDGEEFAFANLAASACGLDIYESIGDKQFFRTHFLPCFKKLDISPFKNDPYYKNIIFPKGENGKWSFETRICKPYEAFVYDDPKIMPDGRVLPCIGFFDKEYPFPAVIENGREWMTLMPNETNTTKPAIEVSHGKVLTYGLGLGYYAYMSAIKAEVESVTVVERSHDVIELFEQYILPQFPDPKKVEIVERDAFEYAENEMQAGEFDTVFVDIWHDPSDGCDLYLKMKKYEYLLPNATFVYWIEDTLKLYI